VSQSTGAYTSASACPYTTSSTAANKGTVYVVAGSTGASGTTQTGYPHDALPLSVNDGGVFYFEVDNNRLDAKFIERTGTIYDQFTIMRDVNKTTNYIVNVNTPVTLTSSWPGNYTWSTSATTQSINVTPLVAGTTNYTVTDSYGCVTDNFSVTATVVLPVSLLNYEARLVGDKVNINWSTSSETKSKEFTVEKSGNATGNFQMVGKLAAAGESDNIRNYMMVDLQPMTGISYYRLSQTDIDGHLRYYDVRKINNQSGSFAVNQVANENGSLILQIKATQSESLKLKVVDLTGKEIIVTNIVVLAGINQKEFALKPGGYVWEVKNNRGERATQVTIVK